MEPQGGVPPEISAGLADFTGRDWAHAALDDWVVSDDRGLYVVGGPGTGKSLFVADLIRLRTDHVGGRAATALAAWHFCRSRNDEATLPEHMIGALASHLSALPGYRESLTEVEPGLAATITGAITVHGNVEAGAMITAVHATLVDVSAERQFDRLVRAPLKNMAGRGRLPDRLILAIDGLDEALAIPDGELLVKLLARQLAPDSALPTEVRLLLTGRPDRRITSRLHIPQLDLGTHERSDADVRQYAVRRLRAVLDETSADRLAGRLTAAAKGTFLYVRYVLDDLLADRARLADADPRTMLLPTGLAGYYAASLDRELTSVSERWEARYRPLLGILAVARIPGFTAAELAEITGLPRSRIDDALKRCSQYLVGRDGGPYRMFHQSFTDYLLADGDHTVYPKEAHAAVARYLANAGSERAEHDLIWHLAGAGDLQALDRHLTAERLAATEIRRGGPAVVADLRYAAGAAAQAGDLPRTLRWSWAAVGRRRHIAESVAPGLLPLIARTGGLDDAIRAVASLNPGDPAHDQVITQLAVHLVDLGRTAEALALVRETPLQWGSTPALAAVAERLACHDPATALRIARELALGDGERRGICAALASAGTEYITEAEDLAGTNLEALRAVAVATGRHDLDRALALADRTETTSWERAAGNKVRRSRMTIYADLVADQAARNPASGAALLRRLIAAKQLRDDDAARAIVATALRLGPADGGDALALLDLADEKNRDLVRLNDTERGLILAAAATAIDDDVQQHALDRWRLTDLRNCWTDHGDDPDLLVELDLAPLRRTATSRAIACAALAHAADRIVGWRAEFEYPGTGTGALAAAFAIVDPAAAPDILNRAFAVQPRQQSNERAEATLQLVRALASTDRQRAFELAISLPEHESRLALVALIDSVAPVNITDALAVVDSIPTHDSGTRAMLLGACARHVPFADSETLSNLRARLPQRRDSETFHTSFTGAGIALAARLTETNPALAEQVVDRCATGLTLRPSLRDPYTIAQAVHLAATDPSAALQLAQTAKDEGDRARGTIAVLRATAFSSEVVAATVRDTVLPYWHILGSEGERAFAELLADLGVRDLNLAIGLGTDFHAAFARATTRLRDEAFDRWGADEAVRRLVVAVLASPVKPEQDIWTIRGRMTMLFDAQTPDVDALVLAALDTTKPDLRAMLEPWALAPAEPDAALALWQKWDEGQYGREEVIYRAARSGISVSLTVFRRIDYPTKYDHEALLRAIRVAARVNPRETLAEVEAFAWENQYRRSQMYRAVAEGAAAADPELAVSLVEGINDLGVRAHTIGILAAIPSITADPANHRWGSTALLALVDPLPLHMQREATLAVVNALGRASRPPPSLMGAILNQAANWDVQTFDDCLPDLMSAACTAQPDHVAKLVDELDTVAELITA